MLGGLKQALRRVLLGKHQRVLGDPSRLGSRILHAVIILSAMGAAAALWALLIRDVDAGGGSYGVMAPVVKFATSTWSYVILELLLLRGLLRVSDSRKARQAGTYLGLEADSVQRLAAEAKTTSGSTRVVCTSEDTEEEIRERLLDGFTEGEDDILERDTSELQQREHPPEPDSTEDAGEEGSLSWGARFKLWRMDTAAALESGDLLWQFAAPAGLTIFLVIIAAGIWLQPWLYPLIFSLGVFIGAVNYWRISRSREKQRRELQEEENPEPWDACSVLVKGPVRTEGVQMAYAWFNGSGYAAYTPGELSRALAPRVHALLHGEPVQPSVHAKYYRNVRDMYPDLHGWRRNVEEHQISEILLETVEAAPDGIIPLPKLMEDVVLHDKGTRLWGLMETGEGADPELVRKCYQELYPWALVEEQLEVESATGETHSVRAVRLRQEPLPADLSEVRANFSTRFRAYAEFEPRYELPEAEHQISEEPLVSAEGAGV